MSLTYAAQQDRTTGKLAEYSARKSAAIVAVVLLHIGFFYAFTHGLNVVTIIQPFKNPVTVFIPEKIRPEVPPPVPLVKSLDVQVDNFDRRLPAPVITDSPPDVPVITESGHTAITADADSNVSGSPATGPARAFAITQRVNPLYPVASRRAGESGTVVLDIVVGPDGAPSEIKVLNSSGYAALDESAMTAVRKWRFTVSSDTSYARVRLPITFKLETVR